MCMPKVHELKTLSEILEVVTPKNLENFIKDFTSFLRVNLALKEIPDIAILKISNEEHKIFRWIDDGKNDVIIKIKKEN